MKQSKFWIFSILTTGIILIIALILGLYISNDIKNKTASMNMLQQDDADYHLMLLLKASEQAYGQEFISGVMSLADQYKIAIETIYVPDNNYLDDVIDRLDMAIYAKVDGIALHAYNDPRIIDRINQASEMGIPVITLNENIHQSKRIAYVGNSRYSIGINVGKTIASLTGNSAKIAVIDQINYKLSDADGMDLLTLGIHDVIESYEGMELAVTRHTEQGVLSAESLATDIIDHFPSVNAIFCTDGQSTLGIAQVLIDNNRVNDFTLIGFGNEQEILSYIEKGTVVEATLVTNYNEIGKGVVQAFYDYITTGIVNSQILPTLNVVDKSNLNAYLKEWEAIYEESE